MTDTITTPPKKMGLAIASLLLGILSFFCLGPLAGIPAIILGVIAVSRVKRSPEEFRGSGVGMAGIITGAIGSLFGIIIPLLIAILLPSLSRAREIANRTADAAHMRSIGTALEIYLNENNGRFPPSLGAAAPELPDPKSFVSRKSSTTPPTYTLPLSDWNTVSAEVESHTDWIYVGARLKNTATSDIITMYSKDLYEHQGRNILFADDHVQFVKTADLPACFAANNDARAKFGLPPIELDVP